MSHCGLAIHILKSKYLKAKEELRKRKYLTMQKYHLSKILIIKIDLLLLLPSRGL